MIEIGDHSIKSTLDAAEALREIPDKQERKRILRAILDVYGARFAGIVCELAAWGVDTYEEGKLNG